MSDRSARSFTRAKDTGLSPSVKLAFSHDGLSELLSTRHRWLVTGVAGFIGSNLLEFLLSAGQDVVGLDNFATGHRRNLDLVRAVVSEGQWKSFTFIEGDIRDLPTCERAVAGAEFVLHQAALGSVPRSIADPAASHDVNVNGFLKILLSSRDAGVRRFVYASSSSVYGDSPTLPKHESHFGYALSPYAVTKATNEAYARVFSAHYGLPTTGLRYFNVFGPRQDPAGAYAAVIPRWIEALVTGRACVINGDGQTSRDFCFVANAVLANVLSAVTKNANRSSAEIFNVACSEQTTLRELHSKLTTAVARARPDAAIVAPTFELFRAGDIRHSLADVSAISEAIGFAPVCRVDEGVLVTVASQMAIT